MTSVNQVGTVHIPEQRTIFESSFEKITLVALTAIAAMATYATFAPPLGAITAVALTTVAFVLLFTPVVPIPQVTRTPSHQTPPPSSSSSRRPITPAQPFTTPPRVPARPPSLSRSSSESSTHSSPPATGGALRWAATRTNLPPLSRRPFPSSPEVRSPVSTGDEGGTETPPVKGARIVGQQWSQENPLFERISAAFGDSPGSSPGTRDFMRFTTVSGDRGPTVEESLALGPLSDRRHTVEEALALGTGGSGEVAEAFYREQPDSPSSDRPVPRVSAHVMSVQESLRAQVEAEFPVESLPAGRLRSGSRSSGDVSE